jgi:copper(I)-binding protein
VRLPTPLLTAAVVTELLAGLVGLTLALGPASAVETRGGWIRAGTDSAYFTIRNRSAQTLEIDAVTSRAAATAVLHHGPLVAAGRDGRLAHLFCGDPPADPPEGYVSADFDTMPLALPPHSDVVIDPGHGRLELIGLDARAWRGPWIDVRLYLDTSQQVDLRLAVR